MNNIFCKRSNSYSSQNSKSPFGYVPDESSRIGKITVVTLVNLLITYGFFARCHQVTARQLDRNEDVRSNDTGETETECEIPVKLLLATSRNKNVFLGIQKGPPLPSGAQATILIRATNASAEELRFTSITRTCACQEVVASNGNALPGESIDFTVQYKVPANARRGVYRVGLELRNESGATVGTVNVNGEVTGCLSLDAESIYESTGRTTEWKLPITATNPVNASEVGIELGPSLQFLETRIVQSGKEWFLVVSGSENDLGDYGTGGEITITHPSTAVSDTKSVLFVKRKLIQISPAISKLVRQNDKSVTGDEAHWQASYLIRADQEIGPLETIECSADGWEIELKANELRNGVWKVKLRTELAEPAGERPREIHLTWKIGSETHKVEYQTISLLDWE